MDSPLLLHYPFHGSWMARNSPARRVPSHGTRLFGSSHAIDFIGVDAGGRSAPWGLRAALGTEPPERFTGFGRPVLAPIAGEVVIAHQGEPDHVARRSLPAGLWYLLGQAGRARGGAAAIAGNHVVVAASEHGPFVLLAHLREGSLRVGAGDRVAAGDPVGECGNSGNSIQPHVHVQATDSIQWQSARGLPIRFRGADGVPVLPAESQVVTVP
ncbi:peptidase M23 [Arthrobacter sp. UCD-GKA]|nr:peptidase M23 [Arthrobacter sp. UCD-GKA]